MKGLFFLVFPFFITCNSKKNNIPNSTHFSTFSNTFQMVSFEPEENLGNHSTLKKGISKTGEWACELDNTREFSILFSKKVKDIKHKNILINRVLAHAWFYPTQTKPDAHIVLVIKNKNDSTLSWQSKGTSPNFFPLNQWTKLNAAFKIEQELNDDDELVVYIWNRGKTQILVDDLSFTFGEYIITGDTPPLATINYLTDSVVYAYHKRPTSQVYFSFVKDFLHIPFEPQTRFAIGNFFSSNTSELLAITNDTAYFWQYLHKKKTFTLYEKIHLKNLSVPQKNKLFTLTEPENDSLPFYLSKHTLYVNNSERPEIFWVSENEKKQVVFNKFPLDMNPLFYEMQLIFPFYIENEGEHILCIVANCQEFNYTGKNCHQLETLPNMKNSIILFSKK
ncbi:MAG: hypothetical protein HUU48_01025 [Flavobacteriales bacterium]|nr:hypothetical protein [Flavobacteriales bacterium]